MAERSAAGAGLRGTFRLQATNVPEAGWFTGRVRALHETVGLKEACVAMFGHGGAEHWLYRLLGRLQMTQEAFLRIGG